GRTILPADDTTPGAGAVAVISFHFWREFLASDPAIVGKTLSINGTPFEVVGGMGPGFLGMKQDLESIDLWPPVSMHPTVRSVPTLLAANSPLSCLHLFGRLDAHVIRDHSALLGAQNWLNQQVRNGIREREGTPLSRERQLEISRETVNLLAAAQGVSEVRV